MSTLEAIILGLIQGFTEFLPVSSSGHLEIANYVMQTDYSDEKSLQMTVVLHFATALSTIVIFRKDLLEIFKGLFQFKWNEESKFSVKIILSMIPAALVGFFMEDFINQFFGGQIVFVGFMLLITAGLLILADRAKKTDNKVGFGHALIIGISQAIAILPGISRSGATISTSVILGIDREKAARFSFLMVVPLILGKMAKDMLDDSFLAASVEVIPLIIGFLAAFISGIVACRWMIALVKKAKLTSFAIYCFIVGIVAISATFFIQ